LQPVGYITIVEIPLAGTAVASPSRCVELDDDTMIHFLVDGAIDLPPDPFYEGGNASFADRPDLVDAKGHVVMSVGAVLVRGRSGLALVDTGVGPRSVDLMALVGQPGSMTGGRLLESLGAIGVSPPDIDTVILSHLHPDHTGWLADAAGRPVFSSAEHVLAEAEWRHWAEPSDPHLGPAPEQVTALEAVGPRFVEDGETVWPGVSVLATPGHTPGHISVVIQAADRRAIVLGDAIHCPIEISRPHVALKGDVDPLLAAASRARLRAELARPRTLTVGAHFPEPVFTRVTGDGDGFSVGPWQ
jgi:glyoxylase-like metal-dependent hydrolase (beta-lactamase superfamily II)